MELFLLALIIQLGPSLLALLLVYIICKVTGAEPVRVALVLLIVALVIIAAIGGMQYAREA